MKRIAVHSMQAVHLVLLFLIPPLWFLVRQASEPDDAFARSVTGIGGLATVVWGSVVVVLSIRHGDKGKIAGRLFSQYRRLLTCTSFLFVADIVLAVGVSLLGYQAAAYRQVEFTSLVKDELILSDALTDNPRVIGSLNPAVTKRLRLKTGIRHVAFWKLP
jgi:hypothetical protein